MDAKRKRFGGKVATITLKNVPEKGVYNWDPGAFLGIYRPDTFWFSK